MKSILIVDDFENTIFVTALTLETKGYKVYKALSGEAALNILAQNKVDLIISDYNMPNMNGLELVARVKKLPGLSRIPILILSTETRYDIKEKAFEMGVTSWIKKPFKIEEFLKVVEMAIK